MWHTVRFVDDELPPHLGEKPLQSSLDYWPKIRGKQVRARFARVNAARVSSFHNRGCDCQEWFWVASEDLPRPLPCLDEPELLVCRRQLQMD